MSRHAKLIWLFAAIATVLAAVVAAAPASVQSAGGVNYVTASSKVPGLKSRTLTATCPKHNHVLGGGEVNSGAYGSILLRQSFPFDSADKDAKPDDGWKVRLKNQASQPVTVKASAICGKTNVHYTAVRFVATGITETGQKTATCPQGKFAYSGGFSAPAKSRIFMNSSFPNSATEWGIYVDNPASHAEDKAAVIAVCGNSTPAVISADDTAVPAHTRSQLQPTCPVGKHVYGGGLSTSAGFNEVAINSLGPATGWKASSDVNGSGPRDMTAYAVCGPALN